MAKSINQQIHYLLDKDPAVRKCLRRELINVRSLARSLIKEHSLTYTPDAVISAIRRYDLDDVNNINTQQAADLFSKMEISTKDGVARILLKEKSFKEISDDYLTKKVLKENLRIVRAKETLTLIVTQRNLGQKLNLFKQSDVIAIHENLSEIRLHFTKDVDVIKGVFAQIATELALQNVNIEEVIYSIPDLLLYVRDEDLVDAHKSILQLKKKKAV